MVCQQTEKFERSLSVFFLTIDKFILDREDRLSGSSQYIDCDYCYLPLLLQEIKEAVKQRYDIFSPITEDSIWYIITLVCQSVSKGIRRQKTYEKKEQFYFLGELIVLTVIRQIYIDRLNVDIFSLEEIASFPRIIGDDYFKVVFEKDLPKSRIETNLFEDPYEFFRQELFY